MIRAFSIFDDFPESAIQIMEKAGVRVSLLPEGMERPSGDLLKKLLNDYDIILISTAQRISEDMLEAVSSPKIIGTVSSGTDHISIPKNKRDIIQIASAGSANKVTVTEHIIALILALRKRLVEGRRIAEKGFNKRMMGAKPNDLFGATVGVVGAGSIARTFLRYSSFFGMSRLCWTFHPNHHLDLMDEGVSFVSLETLFANSDIIVVNIPLSGKTEGLVDSKCISLTKENAIFVSTARPEVIDLNALFERAKLHRDFRIGLDLDPSSIKGHWDLGMDNIIVTPHIAGGTVESRIRLFEECSLNCIRLLNNKWI